MGLGLMDQAEKGFSLQSGLCWGLGAAPKAPCLLISWVPRESFGHSH